MNTIYNLADFLSHVYFAFFLWKVCITIKKSKLDRKLTNTFIEFRSCEYVGTAQSNYLLIVMYKVTW